jgi:parvulin-like peptidyl-prolyl isomerase
MKWIFFLTVLSLSTSMFASNADPVVAEVNGTTIKKSTLLSYHKQNLNFVKSTKTVTMEASLNDLIDRIIGVGSAKKVNLHKRADVVKKMNDVVYHAFISDELTPKLNKIKITDSQIDTYYKKYPEYKTSQILLRLRTLPSEDEVANALETSVKIYNEAVKNPKLFPKLAQQYSQTTTSTTGGDMGYQPRIRLAEKYYESIKGKKEGYVTKPFRTQYGIHVVLVTGEKQLKQIDRALYKKILYDVQRDSILVKYFANKRKSAKIKINKAELLNE